MKDVFKGIILLSLPRILGLGNREAGEDTFGCFDRYYWHYKQVDFPNARFQEATLLLALLYRECFAGNIYYNNPKVLSWISGALRFWTVIQHKNGSFDEAYPNEYSFVATAFSTYAVTESMLILGQEESPRIRFSIERAGNWLLKHNSPDVANQIAASLSALYNIYLLSGFEKYKAGCDKKVTELLSMQSDQGFFFEYGGYDIGYLSIALSYLADYYRKTKDTRLEQPLNKAIDFLRKHIDEDGTFDYKNTSRKTQYIYPSSLLLVGGSDIIKRCIAGLEQNKILNPLWMDDRFCIPLAIDYLKTYLLLSKKESGKNANDDI